MINTMRWPCASNKFTVQYEYMSCHIGPHSNQYCLPHHFQVEKIAIKQSLGFKNWV